MRLVGVKVVDLAVLRMYAGGGRGGGRGDDQGGGSVGGAISQRRWR